MLAPVREGIITSGASHLETPTLPGVAAAVKLGSESICATPYSVKRACPLRSVIIFIHHLWTSIRTITQLRKWGDVSTLRSQRWKFKQRIQVGDPPASNPMWNIERMKVFQSLRDVEQLQYVRKTNRRFPLCCHGNKQSRTRDTRDVRGFNAMSQATLPLCPQSRKSVVVAPRNGSMFWWDSLHHASTLSEESGVFVH